MKQGAHGEAVASHLATPLRRAIAPLALAWLVLGGGAVPLLALSINPGRTLVRLKPGEKIQRTLMVLNEAKEPVRVSLSTKDWFLLETNRAKNLLVDRWIKLPEQKEFELAPGESRDVQVTVTAPKEAEGELVGMVSFMYTSGPAAMMTPMISVSVYLEITGTEKLAGVIDHLAVRTWQNQIQAAASVKATGNVHVRPTGWIEIKKASGQDIGRWPIRESGPAYPGRSQGYFASIPEDFKLEPGHYRVRAELEYRDLKFEAERGFKVSQDKKIEMESK